MIYILILGMFLGFEIQKLIQFNFFFRLKCITTDYYNSIVLRENSFIQKELIKIGLIDFVYYIVILIGLFTINKYLFIIMIVQYLLTSSIFSIKNKIFRKIVFISDSLLSITILCLIIVNSMFYNIDSLEFIKILINNF